MLFIPLTSAALAMPAQAQAPSQEGADTGLQKKNKYKDARVEALRQYLFFMPIPPRF